MTLWLFLLALLLSPPALADGDTIDPPGMADDPVNNVDRPLGGGPSYSYQKRDRDAEGALKSIDDIRRDRDYRRWQQDADHDRDKARNFNKARDYRKARGLYKSESRRNRRPKPTD